MIKTILRRTYSCFILILLLSGCANIPREAPELSMELGKRISAIESSHLVLLHRFFDQKRADVERFVDEEWVPVFAEDFFSTPRMAEAWNTIVSENDRKERLKFIVTVGLKLQDKINEKRQELVKPLDGLERQIEERIRGDYAQARAINNSITSFLVSASRVEENRKRYLEMLGVTDEQMGTVIDKTDSTVSAYVKKARDAKEGVEAMKEYLERMKAIRESMMRGGGNAD